MANRASRCGRLIAELDQFLLEGLGGGFLVVQRGRTTTP